MSIGKLIFWLIFDLGSLKYNFGHCPSRPFLEVMTKAMSDMEQNRTQYKEVVC